MTEFPVVLVINCGSSSVKFSVLDAADGEELVTGMADGVNTENAFIIVNGGEPVPLARRDYEGALAAIALELEKRDLMSSVALIGHRIAHGGTLFSESTLITAEVIEQIRQVSPLAPLHNYANLNGVEAAQQRFPGVRQVAAFDTSFHQTLPPEAYLYGLPYRYYEDPGVRRYGFHGTSHRYVSQQAHRLLGLTPDDSGLVIAHLGNGASVCAVRNGKSADTSMGMTPLDKAWHSGHGRAQLAIKTFCVPYRKAYCRSCGLTASAGRRNLYRRHRRELRIGSQTGDGSPEGVRQ